MQEGNFLETNSAGFSFVYFERDSSAEVWNSLTFHSTALGLLQPSQLLASLEHCTSGAWPAMGLCSVAFDPSELRQKWESVFPRE